MFKQPVFNVFGQNITHFEFDANNTFQKSGNVATKTGQVNFKQPSIMVGYKRNIPERLSCSQAKVGQGSPLCDDCVNS